MSAENFKKFVQEELAPKLWKGAVIVMDNLRVHKVEGVEEMIEAVGARVVYLSPYSPGFNLRRTFMVGTTVQGATSAPELLQGSVFARSTSLKNFGLLTK